jgi:hypothetical protein
VNQEIQRSHRKVYQDPGREAVKTSILLLRRWWRGVIFVVRLRFSGKNSVVGQSKVEVSVSR